MPRISDSKIPDAGYSKIPDSKIPGIPDSKIPDAGYSRFQVFRVQVFQISIPNSRYSREAGVPKF
ncbi:MAG: hypothetical protein IPN69_18010 [Acidobacteria bacterium]|nr:hypothetical protein [Acidobacteriota bacterium]MBK8151525.1 hypothetical protein [Acidobacteriota bacterium]MBK8812607.1 hypothetical protein [Acidobacteriota bacterium]